LCEVINELAQYRHCNTLTNSSSAR
jgi:hypothetical protein